MDDFEKMKKRLLKNPEFKKLHEETRLEFEIARAVIRARIEKGLTQKELAQKIGTKQSVISRLESGRANPSVAFLKKLAQALNSHLEIRFTSFK